MPARLSNEDAAIRADIARRVNSHLARVCQERKWSPTAVLADAGLNHANLHRWFRGGAAPYSVSLVKLARALGISPRDLLPAQ